MVDIMNFKNTVRRKLFSKMSDTQIELFYKVYYRLRYNDEMRKKIKCGNKNADKVFYVIRPRTDGIEGLLSLFWNVIRNIDYAIENNYIPVVDFQNYKTQYTMTKDENAWDYYFTQPSNYTLEEVYESQNVIISGLEIIWYKNSVYKADYSQYALDYLHQMVFKYVDYSDEVKRRVNDEIAKLNIDMDNTIGLYLRGTDYIKLKPSGHPVQPTPEQAIKVVDEFMEQYDLPTVFLVTEDGDIYDAIKNRYGDKCVTPTFDSYIYGYKGDAFLSCDKKIDEIAENAYERGMQYLIKMIIISECGYLIGGNTNGMWAANVFAKHEYRDKFIFDLGLYGK